MRLIEPLSGSVLLDGEDVLKLDQKKLRERRARMQMIFQDPFASLNPRMTVGTAVAEPLLINKLANRREAQDKVADLLERVGLQPDMASRFRMNSPAGSVSASRSPAPSRSSRASSSPTRPSPRSMSP